MDDMEKTQQQQQGLVGKKQKQNRPTLGATLNKIPPCSQEKSPEAKKSLGENEETNAKMLSNVK